MTMPIMVYADESAPNNATEAEFDSSFLIGDAQKIDISRFKYGNPVLPGEYNVDVYVNGQWMRLDITAQVTNMNVKSYTTERIY